LGFTGLNLITNFGWRGIQPDFNMKDKKIVTAQRSAEKPRICANGTNSVPSFLWLSSYKKFFWIVQGFRRFYGKLKALYNYGRNGVITQCSAEKLRICTIGTNSVPSLLWLSSYKMVRHFSQEEKFHFVCDNKK
jgi:hypothetical protein